VRPRPTAERRAPALAAVFLAAALPGCDLREITIAVPADIIVAEVVLRPGSPTQTAYLHRTLGSRGTARVFDAVITVSGAGPAAPLEFHVAADSLCLRPAPEVPPPSIGTCYTASGPPDVIRPGGRYTLDIVLPDGSRLAGTTVVPGAFDIVVPAAAPCRLAPGTTLPLTWTQAAGASVYIAEVRMPGLFAALRAAGVDVEGNDDTAVELLGVAIGAADTSIAFPGGFGLFDRFDESYHGLLLAIRHGLPAGVHASVVVAAADRNYVNWVRGGAFNPSGTVRIPSINGPGTGVFGSIVTRQVEIRTDTATQGENLPRCDGWSGND
jgi:hypothetical protein